MNNELLIEKPWWKRNLIWLLVLTAIIAVLITSGRLFFNGNLDFYALANADPSFYEAALDSANNNQKVVEKFGHLKFVSDNQIYDGKAFYSNNKNSLNIILPVNGIKEKATMDLWLHRNSEGWKYDSIIIKNSAVKINVAKAPATNSGLKQ